MRTHEIIELRGAVLVTAQALDELNQTLEQIAASLGKDPVPTPNYSGVLSDGTKVEFDSFAELAGYPNRSSRRLTRINAFLATELESKGQERTFKMVVAIGASIPCWINIDGEQRHSMHARELMQNIIERIRANYGWIYWPESSLIFLITAALFGAVTSALFGHSADRDYLQRVKFAADMLKANPSSESTQRAIEAAKELPWIHTFWGVEYWMICVGIILVSLAFIGLRAWPWRQVVLEIGQEIERNATRREWRKWITVTVLAGVPLALLVRLLATKVGL